MGEPYTPAAWSVLYATFRLNVATLPSATGDNFAELKTSDTSDLRCRIFINTESGKYRLGVANGSPPASAVITNDLSANVNYTVGLRYVVGNAASTIWLNPSDAS